MYNMPSFAIEIYALLSYFFLIKTFFNVVSMSFKKYLRERWFLKINFYLSGISAIFLLEFYNCFQELY